MLQALGHFTRRHQDEGVAARRRVLEQAKLPVIDPRVFRDLRKISTHHCEVMPLVDLPDLAHPLRGRLVAQAAAQGIARVGRIYDHASCPHGVGRPGNQSRLGIVGMDREYLCRHVPLLARLLMQAALGRHVLGKKFHLIRKNAAIRQNQVLGAVRHVRQIDELHAGLFRRAIALSLVA